VPLSRDRLGSLGRIAMAMSRQLRDDRTLADRRSPRRAAPPRAHHPTVVAAGVPMVEGVSAD
jgi:hypothetical protein